MILRLPKSDLRLRGGNAGRLSTEISAPVAGRISTSIIIIMKKKIKFPLSSSVLSFNMGLHHVIIWVKLQVVVV